MNQMGRIASAVKQGTSLNRTDLPFMAKHPAVYTQIMEEKEALAKEWHSKTTHYIAVLNYQAPGNIHDKPLGDTHAAQADTEQ